VGADPIDIEEGGGSRGDGRILDDQGGCMGVGRGPSFSSEAEGTTGEDLREMPKQAPRMRLYHIDAVGGGKWEGRPP